MHTRRAITIALAATPFAGTTAPASAPDDPIFAAIDAHRAAHARRRAFFAATTGDDLPDELGHAEMNTLAGLLATTPTTLAGCAAMLRYVGEFANSEEENPLFGNFTDPISKPAATLLGRIAAVIEQAGA